MSDKTAAHLLLLSFFIGLPLLLLLFCYFKLLLERRLLNRLKAEGVEIKADIKALWTTTSITPSYAYRSIRYFFSASNDAGEIRTYERKAHIPLEMLTRLKSENKVVVRHLAGRPGVSRYEGEYEFELHEVRGGVWVFMAWCAFALILFLLLRNFPQITC